MHECKIFVPKTKKKQHQHQQLQFSIYSHIVMKIDNNNQVV